MDNSVSKAYVRESSFGKWFLRSNIWTDRVLEIAISDLATLLPKERTQFDVIADVGCGYGRSLIKLSNRYAPKEIVAIDIDQEMLDKSAEEASKNSLNNVKLLRCSNSNIDLAANSVDMLFCHQTFHHLIYQKEAINEYFRILKPGGVLLFAESTKRYIHSWIIKLLFRHPMKVQKTADEYLDLIKSVGFKISEKEISYPYLWWSREDMAIPENWFGIKPPVNREETLVNLIAHKPRTPGQTSG